ncbi:hypothetical protein HYPSUDRAFT_1074622 [Hypholoma sublateritium FD-334 SS-4]|uniref:Uncharacterized protein n=1 Tax=Hypholoma sublateritium (strain FD-334 SS-4) TaxID=945553 RepID=A0A0D2NZT4_HYPSF|nr:hypothetical protein HYPSUDRAFT_1074622 [Hypholoma sublateritium FD-334 SS-4]
MVNQRKWISPEQIGIHGDLVVMRVASHNVHSVVNMRSSDDRYVDSALRSQQSNRQKIPRQRLEQIMPTHENSTLDTTELSTIWSDASPSYPEQSLQPAASTAMIPSATIIMPNTNVWANDADAVLPQNDEEAFVEMNLIPMDPFCDSDSETPRQITHEGNLRRKHGEEMDVDQNILNTKRVAVAGPNQQILDDSYVQIRDREEITRHRALEHAVRLRNQRKEIQVLRSRCEEEERRRAADQETETQMTEQILQYERKIMELTKVNEQLAQMMNGGQQQLDQLNKQCEAMNSAINHMRTENERDKSEVYILQTSRENEILGLRQRLNAATEKRRPNSTPTTPQRNTPINYRIIQGNRANIGVVPLRPANPSTDPGRGPTANPPTDPGRGPTANTSTDPGRGATSTAPEVPLDLNNPQGEQTVHAIVKEVLQQMNADISVKDSSRRRARRSVRSQNQCSIQEQKKTLPKGHDLAWKEVVRRAWKTHFSVSSVADFALYEPAPPAAVEAFETGPHGPNNQNVLDFGKGFEKSRWNKVILKKFVEDLLEERREDGSWDVSDVSHQYLLALFYGQLKRSREAWRQVQSRPIIDEGRMETTTEVAERIDEYTIQRLAMKYERRTKAVEKIICIKLSLNAPDLTTWQYFRDLLIKLSVDGMSSEEEGVTKLGDIHVPVFRVKICVWRNPVLTDYLKYIDKESQNPAIRPNRGSKLHPRIQIDEPGVTPAPKELPRCLYKEDWLKAEEEVKGKEWIEEELKVSREFSVSQDRLFLESRHMRAQPQAREDGHRADDADCGRARARTLVRSKSLYERVARTARTSSTQPCVASSSRSAAIPRGRQRKRVRPGRRAAPQWLVRAFGVPSSPARRTLLRWGMHAHPSSQHHTIPSRSTRPRPTRARPLALRVVLLRGQRCRGRIALRAVTQAGVGTRAAAAHGGGDSPCWGDGGGGRIGVGGGGGICVGGTGGARVPPVRVHYEQLARGVDDVIAARAPRRTRLASTPSPPLSVLAWVTVGGRVGGAPGVARVGVRRAARAVHAGRGTGGAR